jgi:hypothetical protein
MKGVFLMIRLYLSSRRLGWSRRKPGLLMCTLSMLVVPEFGSAQNFRPLAQAAGLESVAGTNGVAVADYDRDGDLDIYFVVAAPYKSNDKRTWNRLFANNGDGTFQDVTTTAGVAAKANIPALGMGLKTGASWGDYDNDGWPDLFVTRFGPNQLFHNNGDGTFTDVTEQAGVAGGKTQYSASALWFDYDLDGDLDLYVSVWEDHDKVSRDTRNWMYENLGDGRFLEVSEASGLADSAQTWMSVAIDVNNDGRLDLYLANDFGANKLYLNNGDKTFQEKTADFGLEDEGHGMGLAVADCDGNGYFDIYLTNITETNNDGEVNPLFLNTGENYFINKSVEAGVSLAGWGWGTEFFDLENDGDEDLFVVNGYFSYEFAKRLFRNESDSSTVHFKEIAKDVGLADITEGRGLAVFDCNDDGHPDLVISNPRAVPSLYENPMRQGNWLKIKLEGTISNRDAFGTVVEVRANGKAYKKYYHGAQFLGQNIIPLHLGLGDAREVERIIVNWPSGYVDEIETVDVNQTILIREKSGLVSGVRQRSENQTVMPEALRLVGNYPNPFNGTTQIRFALGVPGEVEVRITNLFGQTVKVMHEFFPGIGEKAISWDGTDWKARPVSSGLYFYHLKINNEIAGSGLGKMLYIR